MRGRGADAPLACDSGRGGAQPPGFTALRRGQPAPRPAPLALLRRRRSPRQHPQDGREAPRLNACLRARAQLASLGKEGKLSEEEHCLRTCWAAWDKYDRPVQDVIAAVAQKRRRAPAPRPPGLRAHPLCRPRL